MVGWNGMTEEWNRHSNWINHYIPLSCLVGSKEWNESFKTIVLLRTSSMFTTWKAFSWVIVGKQNYLAFAPHDIILRLIPLVNSCPHCEVIKYYYIYMRVTNTFNLSWLSSDPKACCGTQINRSSNWIPNLQTKPLF